MPKRHGRYTVSPLSSKANEAPVHIDPYRFNMPFPIAKEIAFNTRRLAFVLLCVCGAHASAEQAPRNLPDLPSADGVKPGHFGLDGEKAELGYASRQRKWGARLDEYQDLERSVTLDYGTLLTDDLGAGAALRRGSDYSDLWVNGVYAPDHDFRVRVAGGQLRAKDGTSETSGAPSAVQQNSYLLGAKQSWQNGLLSSIGMTAYAVQANDSARVAASTTQVGGFDTDSAELAAGRQQGHVLNLSLQPTARSTLDLSRERNRLTYYALDGSRDDRNLVASRINYSQSFDNCVRLQSGYSTSEDANRLDLSVGRNRWHISVSRVQATDDNGVAVGVGYSVPLGGLPNGGHECASHSPNSRPFKPIIDATVSRPEQFPQDPLTASGTFE